MHPSRKQILDEHGMTHAPAEARALFWRRHNSRRPTITLGAVAAGWVDREARSLDARLGEVGAAWAEVVPPDLAEACVVERFGRGRLVVRVDSSATRYALSRQMGEVLLEALNAKLGRKRVTRIEYRVAAVRRQRR